MNYSNSLLVLSAGRGIGLDGFNKLNLVSPSTGETILDRYNRQLGKNITIVTGYRAPEIMSCYPKFKFVYNYVWYETGSAFSAALGLKNEPTVIVPSDLFIGDDEAETISNASGNVIFTFKSENRAMGAVNITIKEKNILDIYEGPKRNGDDHVFSGIVRVEDKTVIKQLIELGNECPSESFIECVSKLKHHFTGIELLQPITEINSVEEYDQFFREDQKFVKA